MLKKIIFIFSGLVLLIWILIGVNYYTEYRIGYKEVYISSHQLSARNIVEEKDIEKIKVPKDYLGDDVYTSKEDIVGKLVRVNAFVPKGSLFYKDFLEDSSNIKDYVNTKVNEDEVIYDLDIRNVSCNPSHLTGNMLIDIYLTIDDDVTLSDLLFENIKILSLYDRDGKTIKDFEDNSEVNGITLALNKNYVSYLNKALILGKLTIVVGSNAYDLTNVSNMNMMSPLIEYLR